MLCMDAYQDRLMPYCRQERPLEPFSRILQFPHLLKMLSFIQALLPSDTSPNFSMTKSDVSSVSASTV